MPEFKITPFSLINTESQGCRVWIPTFYQIAAITHTVGEPWKDKKNGNTILYDYNVLTVDKEVITWEICAVILHCNVEN